MRWIAELDGEGTYNLRLATPIGPHYVTFVSPARFEVMWFPFDLGDGELIGHSASESQGQVAAENNLKARLAKLRRSLK